MEKLEQRCEICSKLTIKTPKRRQWRYPSAETRPGPIQATKINLFARIVKVFKLRLLTTFG